MADTDKLEWRLFDTDLTTTMDIVPSKSGSGLYFELNEPGSGMIKIQLDSAAAGDVSSGRFLRNSFRGGVRGGFFAENIKKVYADRSEGGGRVLSVTGRGPLALLDDAIVFDEASGSTRDYTAMTKAGIMIELIDEAQARGALANLTYDFTAVVDSDGVAWTDSEYYSLAVGTSLLDVARQFARAGEFDFDIVLSGSSFVLSAYKNGKGTDKSETIYFRVGKNCEEVNSDERGDKIKNVLRVAYKDGYITSSDPTSITNRRRREELFNVKQAQTSSSAMTAGAAKLALTKDPKFQIALRVFDDAGVNVFVDYDLGDTVMLDNSGTETAYRIYGLQVDFDETGNASVVVELNSTMYDNDVRMSQDLDWLLDQWNTAYDAGLLEVSFWAALGLSSDTIVNEGISAMHIIGDEIYIGTLNTSVLGGLTDPTLGTFFWYNFKTGVWGSAYAGGGIRTFASIGTNLYIGLALGAVELYDTITKPAMATDVLSFDWSFETNLTDVRAMAAIGTDLYVGGYFDSADDGTGGATAALHICKYDTLTDTVSAIGAGANNKIWSFAVSGSTLYMGGEFTTLDGGAAVRVGKLISTTYSALGAGLDGTVYALAISGSNLIAGGAFTGKIAEWDTSAWAVLGGGVNNTVYGLAVYLADIYAVGAFTDVGNRIAVYSGGAWRALAEGLNDTCYAIVLNNEDVYVGGKFTTAGLKTAIGVAAYFNNFDSLMDYAGAYSSFDMGAAIHAAAASAITDTDEVPFWEATANGLRKITWANIKTTLKTYFDTLYADLVQTAGRVIISDPVSGEVTTDATLKFNSDNASKQLHLGIVNGTTGNYIFNQGNEGGSAIHFMETYGAGAIGSFVSGIRAQGTQEVPTAVLANDLILRLRARAYYDAGLLANTTAEIRLVADENHSVTNQGSRIEFLATPNGSTVASIATTLTLYGTGAATLAGRLTSAGHTIDTNSTTALLVEQDGVKDNVFIVDTTNARVGIGIVPTLASLHIEETRTQTTSIFGEGGFYIKETVSPSGSSSANISGGTFYVVPTGANNITGNIFALQGYVDNANTGTIETISGYSLTLNNAGIGVINNAVGVLPLIRSSSGTIVTAASIYTSVQAFGGAITTAHGIYISAPTKSGAGTIGTTYGIRIFNQGFVVPTVAAYGLYLGNQTGAPANYAIFTNAGLNSFGDQLAIVGSADRQQLIVTGFTTQAVATPMAQITRNDTAAGLSAMLGLTALGSGANGDGGSILLKGKTSTTAAQSMATIDYRFINATHASYTTALRFYAHDVAGARLGIEIEASGSVAKLGFFGATTIVQPANTTDLRTAIINLGLLASGGATPLDLNGGAISNATKKDSGIHQSMSITYIDGTGTAGADNTAQTVKTITLPANSMTQVGDRIRIRTYWRGDTGTAITGTNKLGPAGSEVAISDTTDLGGATLQVNEAWLHYIDNTHANIIENEAGGVGALSAPNVAGFTWNASQDIIFTQSAAVNNHCVLFALIVDRFPRGV